MENYCQKCFKWKKIHAKGLCNSCYSYPYMKEWLKKGNNRKRFNEQVAKSMRKAYLEGKTWKQKHPDKARRAERRWRADLKKLRHLNA